MRATHSPSLLTTDVYADALFAAASASAVLCWQHAPLGPAAYLSVSRTRRVHERALGAEAQCAVSPARKLMPIGIRSRSALARAGGAWTRGAREGERAAASTSTEQRRRVRGEARVARWSVRWRVTGQGEAPARSQAFFNTIYSLSPVTVTRVGRDDPRAPPPGRGTAPHRTRSPTSQLRDESWRTPPPPLREPRPSTTRNATGRKLMQLSQGLGAPGHPVRAAAPSPRCM